LPHEPNAQASNYFPRHYRPFVSGCAFQPAPSAAVVQSPQPRPAFTQSAPAYRHSLAGKVVSIADGDTLIVLDASNHQHRIRLTGIDAPESRQAFGTRSREHLASLVFGKQVTVGYDKQDRYRRTLGKVIVDGRDANLEQIKSGMAWHYKFYENEQPPQDRKTYAEAEREARAAKRGLWVDPNPDAAVGLPARSPGTTGDGEEPSGGTTATRLAPGASVPRSSDGRPAIPAREPEADTVYITRTGEKYYRLSCRYLRQSRIPVAIKDAKRHYSPCSVCRP
jgi:endonuclease YncB( thermonuclease family)